jgi:hypothetical protein
VAVIPRVVADKDFPSPRISCPAVNFTCRTSTARSQCFSPPTPFRVILEPAAVYLFRATAEWLCAGPVHD